MTLTVTKESGHDKQKKFSATDRDLAYNRWVLNPRENGVSK